MKKQLIWQLGPAGIACWILRYPLLSRHSRAAIRKNPKLKGRDVESVKKACMRLEKDPTTLISFVEGTRRTTQKHERQGSEFKHLLRPKAGGIAIVLQEMHEKLSGIIDVTIKYSKPHASFWEIISGKVKMIEVRYRVREIPDTIIGNYYKDRALRARFQAWLNKIWIEKDAELERMQ